MSLMSPTLNPLTHPIELVRLLAQAEDVVSQHENRYFADLGLNRSQFICLMALGNTDGLKMGEIARELLVTKGSITQLVKEMEIKGFVTKARNPNNEREVIVRLTDHGESAFAMAFPKRTELLKKLYAQVMTPDELNSLGSLLVKFKEGLKAIEPGKKSAATA